MNAPPTLAAKSSDGTGTIRATSARTPTHGPLADAVPRRSGRTPVASPRVPATASTSAAVREPTRPNAFDQNGRLDPGLGAVRPWVVRIGGLVRARERQGQRRACLRDAIDPGARAVVGQVAEAPRREGCAERTEPRREEHAPFGPGEAHRAESAACELPSLEGRVVRSGPPESVRAAKQHHRAA